MEVVNDMRLYNFDILTAYVTALHNPKLNGSSLVGDLSIPIPNTSVVIALCPELAQMMPKRNTVDKSACTGTSNDSMTVNTHYPILSTQ